MNAPVPMLAAPRPSTDWRGETRKAYIVLAGTLGIFVLWANFARIDAAAIAPGIVSAEGNRKTIQHLEGGIVQEILVRDGMAVRAGDLLVRLDPTRLDTQSDLYKNQYSIWLAQEARLMAEFDGRDEVTWPAEVVVREHDVAVAPVIADQKRLFASRRATVRRNIGIAESQIEQTRREIEQIQSDVKTSQATLEQVEAEYNGLLPLYKQKLVPITRMTPLERERLRLQGIVEVGGINTRKLRERLAEFELRRQQVLQDSRQEASTLLIDVRKQLSDLRQQLLFSSDQKTRSEIRAPIAGTVQQLRIYTAGGVIRPGDPILDIAPNDEELVVRAKVAPSDVDRISVGARAEVKFGTLHYQGQQTIYGTLRAISRDRITDEANRDGYFAAELVVEKATVPDDVRNKLVAGLPADVFIITGERTVARYLIAPISDRLQHSMRER